ISVGDGFNQIEAGSGDDRISAGDGENSITAGEGRNRIQAGDGDTQVHTGSGSDDIRLGDGANDIWSEGGDNKISSGDGHNIIVTHDGKDSIKVGNGLNEIDAGEGHNRIDAGKGENRITTGDGNDTIRVKGRENTIEAGHGKNSITAGDGDTEVKTGDGNDTIKLGDGLNWVRDEGGDNRITVGDGTALIETADGKDDIRVGDGYADISTSNGDKKISGGDGSMSVFVGNGRNTITLGDGDNEVHAGDGNNRITIGDGSGFIFVGDGNNSIRTGDSNNQISAGNGNNKISSGDGYNEIITGDGKDDIRVGDGDGEIYAGAGDDKIRTGDGNAEIWGDEGDDSIQTGDGDDKIRGGQGNDQISAGDGYDTVYYAGSFSDYVLEGSRERMQISSIGEGVSDAGIDQLRDVEAIYFWGDGTLLDLTWEGDPTLVEDHVSAQGDDPLIISLSTLLENDEGLGDQLPVFTVSEYSTSGIRVTYDGENITYNADDVLQYLAEGELFEDSFTYSVVDPYGEVFEAVVNVSLTGENDGPVANDDLLIDDTAPAYAVELGERVVVNQGMQGRQADQSVVTLKDGGYLVVWYSRGYYDPDVSVEDRPAVGLWVRSFSENGVPTSHDINVSQVPVSNQTGHDIAVLENGNYVLTWLSADETVGAPGEVRPWCVKARVFEADGTSVTNEFRVSEEWGNQWSHVNYQDVVELENGGFAVTWRVSEYTSTGSIDTPMASVFDNEGQPVREQFALTEDSENLYGAPSMVALPDGGFAIVQAYGTDVQYRHDINIDFYDDAGILTSTYAITDNASEAVENRTPTAKVGPNGEILVTWLRLDYRNTEDLGYYATILNADGTEAVGEFRLDQSSDPYTMPDTTWLDDGRFVVTWTTSTASQIDEVRARVFNPDGSENSSVFVVYEDPNSSGPAVPSVTTLDGDRIVVTWYQERYFETGVGGTDILSRVVDVNGDIYSAVYTDEDSPAVIDIAELLGNDSDVEGDEFIFSLASATSEHGATVTYDAETGALTYDATQAADIQALNGGQAMEDSFVYTISDGHGGIDQATVTIVVAGVDEATPIASDLALTPPVIDDIWG
ncbi:Ig-like domain-containing protein, partial [Parasedimentitalea huanghaiensis]|uniref:Ig-like domain-containing protein n=1 Tax=Parasedimentitalea huanghaiensis TaxID=2682100 RepID=UPI00143227D6